MSNKYPGGIINTGVDAGYSVAFDGTGDRLLIAANAAFNQSALPMAWTVECWVYPNSATTTGYIYATQSNNTDFLMLAFINGQFVIDKGSVGYKITSRKFNARNWYHVAYCLNGNTLELYVNGVLEGTSSEFSFLSANAAMSIGDFGGTNPFDGYISNLRVVKGTTLYRNNFTPPTQLLPILNTTFLACQSPTIIDTSSSALTITTAGDAKVSTFTPFTGFEAGVNGFDPSLGSAAPGVWTIDQATAYQTNRQWPIYDPYFNQTTLLLQGENPTSQTDPAWLTDVSTNNLNLEVTGDVKASTQTPYATNFSNFFNGTSDYLTTTASALNYLGSGDFTVEAWVKVPNISGLKTLVTYGSSTDGMFRWFINNGTIAVMSGSTEIVSLTGTNVLNAGLWYHIAVVRSGSGSNNVKVYVNGEFKLQGTSTQNFNVGTTLSIGAEAAANFFSGHISNLRILPGTALYTSNFTVPSSPLTAVSGTVLLTAQSNRFQDNGTANSGSSFGLTTNGFPTVQYHNPFNNTSFTGGSGYFDGTNDYLSTPGTSIQPGTGNFTFECWIYPNVTQPNNAGIFSTGTSGGLQLSYYLTTGLGSSGVGFLINSTELPIVGAWNHVVFCRGGTGAGQASIFLNGRRIANGQVSTNFSNGVLNLGYQGSGTTALFNGYIAQARYVNSDVYGYTNTSITVPTAPLAPISGTQLLTLQSPTATNNKAFIDSSYNNLPVTNLGNVTQGSFSPFSTSGWSTFFEGSSSAVFGSGESYFAQGTNNFCIEMWVYPTSNPSTNQILWDQRPASTDGAYVTLYRVDNGTVEFYVDSSIRIASTLTAPLHRWTHIALERVSSVTSLYINGVAQSQTYADTTSYLNGASRPIIGRNGSSAVSYFGGYFSSVRFTSSFVYNGNFIPSTQPFAATSNTQFLAFQTNNYTLNQSPNILNTNTLQTLGSPQIRPFSPFVPTYVPPPVSYSYNFDGRSLNGSNVFVNSTVLLNSFSGNLTAEAWIYPRCTSASQAVIFQGGSSTFKMLYSNTGTIYGELRSSTSNIIGGVVVQNTWNHVALVRASGVLSLYLNGNITGASITESGSTLSPANVQIGGASGESSFNGLISNARIVRGTAVYTSNFTPPTSPLIATFDTRLLTCQSPFFRDNSANANPVLPYPGISGTTTTISTFSPFAANVDQTTRSVYSSALVGGSAFFDGTGDYLVTSNIATPTSNIAFTAEAWYYATGLASATARILDANTFSIGLTSGGAIYGEVKNTTTTVSITGPTISTNSWNHVALVRTGSVANNANVFLYHNGLRVGAIPSERGNLVAGGNVTIGSVSGGASTTNFKGYITNARILTNNILYSSNFLPAFAPPTVDSNTSLLLDFADAGLIDSTGKYVLDTIGNVEISSTVTKFGKRSLRFVNGGYLNASSNNVIDSFGTGDFTVEGWLYPTSYGTTRYVFSNLTSPALSTGFLAELNSTGYLRLYSGGSYRLTSSANASLNAWTHVAITRSNSTVNAFINGVKDSNTWTLTTESFTSGTLTIGYTFQGAIASTPFRGYMDEVRVTKGIARYTGNFIPQTSAWQNQ